MVDHDLYLPDEAALRPRQRQLLEELEAFFFTRGYSATSMDDIARILRCSKRALYDFAPNRKALFVLIVARWARRVRRLGDEAAAAHADPRRKLTAYLEPGVSQTRAMTETFLIDLRALSASRSVLDTHQRLRMENLKVILELGVAQGAFKEIHAHLVAGICLAGIEKIDDPAFLHAAGLSFSEAFAGLYRLLMTGLEPAR